MFFVFVIIIIFFYQFFDIFPNESTLCRISLYNKKKIFTSKFPTLDLHLDIMIA